MDRPYNNSTREILPGNIVTTYEEFKQELNGQDLLEHSGFTEKDYSSSELFIDLEYMGRHENNTLGSLTVRIYPSEEDKVVDILEMNGVKRSKVANILDGQEITEEDQIS